MHETRLGRWAGGIYLIVVITGIFSLAYVPTQITVSGDPQVTLENILTQQTLFRVGIAVFLIDQVAFLLLPLVLFRVFAPFERTAATLMVAFALAAIPIALAGVVHRIDALTLLTDANLANVIAPEQLRAMALLALEDYASSIFVASLFWGLWLLPFGYLVVKSRAIPRVFGVLLILGCVGYLLNVFGELLVPGYGDSMLPEYATVPAAFGEIGSCLWLLIFGSRSASAATMIAEK